MSYHDIPRPEHEGLQVNPDDTPPEAVSPQPSTPSYYYAYHDQIAPKGAYSPDYGQIPVQHSDEKLIFGLRKATFILAVLLAVMTTAAVVIGAVLGAKVATNSTKCAGTQTTSTENAQSSSSSSADAATSSATNYVAPTNVHVAIDCSRKNPIETKVYRYANTIQYDLNCNQNCVAEDIVVIWAYSLDMCLEACLSARNSAAGDCNHVVFSNDLGNAGTLGGNCFLKAKCDSLANVTDGTNFNHAVLY